MPELSQAMIRTFANLVYYKTTEFSIADVPISYRQAVTDLLTTYGEDPYFDDHRHHIADVDGLQDELDAKVLKEAGKGLSTNDYTTAEKTKLSGVAANANNYSHPASHPASIITQNATNRFVTDAEKTAWNGKSDFSGSYADLTNKPTIPAAVTLNNTVTSTSATQAATANSVKTANDNANGRVSKAGDTLTGALVAQNNADYTSKQVRNMILSPLDADLSVMGNGDVWVKYK